eukprot:GHVN01060701.1.p1 GENE.GHVN01060701.1~~GHVN01060701.1.p1  ORF type:complete len:248 (+),score=65.78 GHVN01060701.1:152-895(+)
MEEETTQMGCPQSMSTSSSTRAHSPPEASNPIPPHSPPDIPSHIHSHTPPHSMTDGSRVSSSITRATTDKPWEYPSESQFTSSVGMKGYQASDEDLKLALKIHNLVNEETWKRILEYESFHSHRCKKPKLHHFVGRPGDATPRAKVMGLMGFQLPFDRHDWHVDRCGTQVRYVIDFYDGDWEDMNKPVSIHIDARPDIPVGWQAFSNIRDRLKMWWVGEDKVRRSVRGENLGPGFSTKGGEQNVPSS